MADSINQVRGVSSRVGGPGAGFAPNVGAAAARANGGGCCGDSAPCCETKDAACCSSEATEASGGSKAQVGGIDSTNAAAPANTSLFDWFQALLRGKRQDGTDL